MACHNCQTPIYFFVEQNIGSRLCSQCGHRTCLMCSRSSHFPATCDELSLYLSPIHPDDPFLPSLQLCSANIQFIASSRLSLLSGLRPPFYESSVGVALEFTSRRYLNDAVIEMYDIGNILMYLQVVYLCVPNLWIEIAPSVATLERAFDSLLSAFPTPHTPLPLWDISLQRNAAAAATIDVLMSLLRAKNLLGHYTLRDCVPTLPQVPAPQPPADLFDFRSVFFTVIHQMLDGLPVAGDAHSIAYMDGFGFNLFFEMDPHVIDPDASEANLVYSCYAECFLLRFRSIVRR